MKLPYAVVYIDYGLSETVFTNYLNTKWKEGWDYVTHLTCAGPRQALLMKNRRYSGSVEVIHAAISLAQDRVITLDELFASLTAILSDDPSVLSEIRAALHEKIDVRERFEQWLRGLKDRPTIARSSGEVIEISDELLEALAKEEK